MESHSTDATESTRLFDKAHLIDYTLVMFAFALVIIIYHLIFGQLTPQILPYPPSGPPGQAPDPKGPGLQTFSDYWPIWGRLVIPDVSQILLAGLIFSITSIIIWKSYSKVSSSLRLPAIILLGILVMILTNTIQGWEIGIFGPFGGTDSIYQDALNITSIMEFISNYETLQPTLTTHALTQPPGAVLSIYILYLIFGNPTGVALGQAAFCSFVSFAALRQILKKYFNDAASNYGALLFALLPAIQVYYLANVYAIVSTLSILSLYFYLHDDIRVSYFGSIASIFLGTFTSFLFLVIPLSFLIYEILCSVYDVENENIPAIRLVSRNLSKPLVIGVSVLIIYLALDLTLGFNYVSVFLYASVSENPDGFMLFANPTQYFVTRIQNVMDILIFLGPILVAFCYRGLQLMRRKGFSMEERKMFVLVISAFIALLLMFLTGAPKKGETARICMFILPYVLIPIMYRIEFGGYSSKERALLLVLVFFQAVVMQLVGIYIW